jgi:hypothetical protein
MIAMPRKTVHNVNQPRASKKEAARSPDRARKEEGLETPRLVVRRR